MVAYSFKQRFVAPILAGTKRQTIRAERKRHAREGEAIQLYTGMRTKQCRAIGVATCRYVSPIRIDVDGARVEFPTGRSLTTLDELDAFAAMDGFAAWRTMRLFWQAHHPATQFFSGVLIRWVNFEPAPSDREACRAEINRRAEMEGSTE